MAEVKVISKKKKLIVTFIIMLILVFLFNAELRFTISFVQGIQDATYTYLLMPSYR